MFEQLGEQRLEGAVTTDIAGKDHAHALRLDAEATPEVKKARLHRKVATAIFFESNGGQQRGESDAAGDSPGGRRAGSGHRQRRAVPRGAGRRLLLPTAEKNRYRFSFHGTSTSCSPIAARRVSGPAIDERVRAEIQKVFADGSAVSSWIYFPKKSNEIPDRPVLTLVVLPPENSASRALRRRCFDHVDDERERHVVADVQERAHLGRGGGRASIREEARKVLAWEDIEDEADSSSGSTRSSSGSSARTSRRAERDLREAVWRTYKNVFLLADDNSMRLIDLGLVHSSAANSLDELILVAPQAGGHRRRRRERRHFSRATGRQRLPEWSTKAVRDAFYASPKFPRLLKSEAVKDTISRGLDAQLLAYVGKGTDGRYEPFVYKRSLPAATSRSRRRVPHHGGARRGVPRRTGCRQSGDGGRNSRSGSATTATRSLPGRSIDETP